MSQTTHFSISGMHCASCKMLIEDRISELPHIQKVTVDLKGNAVVISSTAVDITEIAKALKGTEYKISLRD